jgi:hypothetical protein
MRDTEVMGVEPPGRPAGSARGRLLLGLALVVAGLVWLLDQAGVNVPWRLLPSLALIAVGVAVLVRPRGTHVGPLIVVGIVLSALVLLATAARLDGGVVGGGAGNRLERPTTLADLRPSYQLGAGELTIDLRDLVLPDGTTRLRARVGTGRLVVRAPAGVALRVDGGAGIGQFQALGEEQQGFGANTTVTGPDYQTATRRLDLDLRVGVGQIEVQR